MPWLLRERWTVRSPLNAAAASAKLASLTGPMEWAIVQAGSAFAGNVEGLGFRLFRRNTNGRPDRHLQMVGCVRDEEPGCYVDVEFRSTGRRSPISVALTLGVLFALAVATRAPLRYFVLAAGLVYLVAVIGFAVATRNAKRLLAGALAGHGGHELEAAAAGPGWARDVIVAVVALAALVLGALVHT